MKKVNVSVDIRNRQTDVDPERMAAAIAKHSYLSPQMAKNCVQIVMDPNEAAVCTVIFMPSLDAADDLADALIDLGVDACVIDHDAES
jgi:hypothetical protein